MEIQWVARLVVQSDLELDSWLQIQPDFPGKKGLTFVGQVLVSQFAAVVWVVG